MILSKKIFIIAMLFVVSNLFSQAILESIESTPAIEIAAKATELLSEKVNLSQGQYTPVFKIYEENWVIKKEIVSINSFFTIRGKIKKQNNEQNESLKEVLTPEQYKLCEESAFKEISSAMKDWLTNK